MTGRYLESRIFVALVLAVGLGLPAGGASAQPPETKLTVRIESQPMGTALKQLADQAGLQVVYPTEVVSPTLMAPAVQGRYTAAAALARLLEGSGLGYHFINPQTVSIRPQAREASSALRTEPQHEALHLARTRAEVPDAEARGESEEGSTGTDAAKADARESEAGTPEILVKGRRNLNVDIRRSEDDPQPYVVFEREEIQRTQAVNLEDFLKTRLPMNVASTISSQTVGDSATHSSSIDLRGFGPNQTLILVNGRRMPGVSTFGFRFQTDINGIPLSAVERIEVLPSTAGGIYGGGATGGVINVILRGDYVGLDVGATYANTFDSDAANMRLDLSTGFSLEGGRTNITMAASHSRANDLLVGDRDFAARGIALQLQNNPALIVGQATPPVGATANVRSVSGPLVLDPEYGGTPLIDSAGQPAMITHLPLGYMGPDSDDGAALLANAGRYNLVPPADLSGGKLGLVSSPSISSVTVNLRREFGPHVEAFVDASHLSNEGAGFFGFSPNFAELPFDAPNNPFQQNIYVRFPMPNLSYRTRFESITARATGGIIIRLPFSWTGEADYTWNRSRIDQKNTFLTVDEVASCVMQTGLPASACAPGDSRPALNVLQEGNTFPVDFSSYLLPAPNERIGPFDMNLTNATLRFAGPLLNLPGGPLNLSVMAERREETLEDARYSYLSFAATNDVDDMFYEHYFYPQRSQDADSYYMEARVPLISARNARSWARSLELQASVRHDRYETASPRVGVHFLDFVTAAQDPADPPTGLEYVTNTVDSTDYTVALRFAPTEDVAFRASMSTGFVAPSVSQLAPRERIINGCLGADPKRGGLCTNFPFGLTPPVRLIQGGNPNLMPELSDSWSAGLVFTPRLLNGLRLSLDYTRIEKTDEIYTPPFQFFLDHEDELPEGRIVRGAKLPTDPAEWEGPVVTFDTSMLNVAKSTLEAYDLQADYVLDIGNASDLRWYVVATWQPDFSAQVIPEAPVFQRVGYSTGPLEWRGNIGLVWRRGPLSLGWNAQYYNAYRVSTPGASQAQVDLAILNQGSVFIPSQTYHDLTAAYSFDRAPGVTGRLLDNTELRLSIQNVLDESPPILAIASPSERGYSTYGDPRLRRYSLTIRKSFGL